MIRLLFAFIFGLVALGAASAQNVQQSGNVTPGHAAAWTTNGVIQDAGTAAIPFLTSIGTWGTGCTIANVSALSGPNYQVCLGTDSSGGFFSLNSLGGASAGTFRAILNGTTYPFPFSSGVVGPGSAIVGDVACWNNSSGTILADCGTKRTAGTAPITLYVATNGSNTNNICTVQAAPCQTISYAMEVAANFYDPQAQQILISVMAGTYAENIQTPIYFYTGGAGHLTAAPILVKCATALAAACSISPSSGNGISVTETNLEWDFEYFTLVGNSNTAIGAIADAHGWLLLANVAFSGTWEVDWEAENGGIMELENNISVTGNVTFREFASSGGLILNVATITSIGTPAYSNAGIYVANNAVVNVAAATYTGAATGVKWEKGFGGQIQLPSGQSLNNYFPGDSSGLVLDVAVGSFSRTTLAGVGNQSITFPSPWSFSPTSCNFKSVMLFGSSDAYVDTQFTPQGIAVTDGGAAPSNSVIANNAIVYTNTAGSTQFFANVVSYDSNGFTVNWAKNGSPSGTINVVYRCQIDP